MSLKERVVREVEHLPEAELQYVADYLDFLKYQAYRKRVPARVSESSSLAALYAEFADEDRALADEGIEEYVLSLAAEDAA
jgi:hypothetical protein